MKDEVHVNKDADHNIETAKDFILKEMTTSGKLYFAYLKKNNGQSHILQNIISDNLSVKENIEILEDIKSEITNNINKAIEYIREINK